MCIRDRSNAVRINRTPRVFTANESPPDVSIFLHHELAQTTVYPSHLFFYCEQPPDGGGETPICRSDLLLEKLEDEISLFVKKCGELGVRYTNIIPSKKDQERILEYIGSKSLDQLIQNTVPKNILLKDELKIGESLSESEALKKLKFISQKNQTFRNFIGMGYYLSLIHI